MTDEQLAELRVHKPAEVARMLNIPITRVETWVPEGRVRHLRAGEVRGVEFTAEHVRELGERLPELMGGHRGGRLGNPDKPQAASAPARVQPTPEVIAAWAQLNAHRPVPRTAALPLTGHQPGCCCSSCSHTGTARNCPIVVGSRNSGSHPCSFVP